MASPRCLARDSCYHAGQALAFPLPRPLSSLRHRKEGGREPLCGKETVARMNAGKQEGREGRRGKRESQRQIDSEGVTVMESHQCSA
eukprot:scaffold219345_cov33-Tisochrysis_lutea.AAC.1